MIFATIDVVKQWDLQQFQALGRTQREAILKALNEDAEKLISEYGVDAIKDPDLLRLQEEMRKCNKIFSDLSAKVKDKGMYQKTLYFTFSLEKCRRWVSR